MHNLAGLPSHGFCNSGPAVHMCVEASRGKHKETADDTVAVVPDPKANASEDCHHAVSILFCKLSCKVFVRISTELPAGG